MAGLPLIATRAGGMPEIVKDQYSGRLIDSGDYEQLANTIEQVLASKNNYGSNAREMVYNTFNQEKQARKMLQLYDLE